ncbi:MAG: glycosyl hydrolase [Bacteroidetes bacterium]|jgi:exo-beta-1,3-glucanase (GH17 family)|nr:glycosyl hydrolase [Bacteroidota bacterium]
MSTKLHSVDFSSYQNLDASEIASELDKLSDDDIRDLFYQILNSGIHGMCFSIYEDGQEPGSVIAESQVRKRMGILEPYISWVRSFSCVDGNEHIPRLAKTMGIKTLVGAWLGNDPEKNESEISALIKLAKEGQVDVAAVGNEVMYRNDLSEEELIEFIQRVKKAVPQVPVGYVDAYYEFSDRPRITDNCDMILCNCYPFWEGCPFEYSLHHMKSMYHSALEAGQGKKVIITETGWPNKGQPFKGSIPSTIHAMKYFINTHKWASAAGIETFYFSSFDEAWKVGPEGDVGAYWGIWDKNGNFKY